MDINKGFTEEIPMSGKLKMTEKIGGGSTTESNSPENSKSKKRSESSLDQVGPKNVKITVLYSKRDETSMSDLSKHSHETDSVPRKKIKNNTVTYSQIS